MCRWVEQGSHEYLGVVHTLRSAQTCLSLFWMLCGFVMPDFMPSGVGGSYVFATAEEARGGGGVLSSHFGL